MGQQQNCNVTIVFNENEEINYFEGIIEDITEKKRGEKLRFAKEAAESANRAKSSFLANIMEKSRTLSPDDQKDLDIWPVDIIRRSGEHLLTLINDILDLSRIEAGKVELKVKDFDLHNLLEDLELMFEQKTQKKRSSIKIYPKVEYTSVHQNR